MPSDSYYPDTSDTAASPDTAGKMDGDKKSGEDEYETALLPKAVLGGKEFKVGEEVVLKIVHDHGDEVEVQYATEEPEKKDESGGEPSDMASADAKLESMAEKD
jgi:hypothetical protein